MTGIGVVEGVECMIVANDPTVKGGALNPWSLKKSFRAAEIAEKNFLPTINLTESGGADLPTQKEIFIPGGDLFRGLTKASAEKTPTIALVFGNSTAGGAYVPGMSDYVVMVKEQAKVFLGGPPLVKMATGEESDDESLGGAEMRVGWWRPGTGERHPAVLFVIGATPLGIDFPELRVAAGEASHVQIFGQDYATPDGTCIRDFIHVRDLGNAHLLALEATGEGDPSLEVYNLGSAAGFSVREVVEAGRRVTGRAIPARAVKRRIGDPPVLVASSRRARRELGWQPRHSTLEEMLADAWAWRQEHPGGYGRRRPSTDGQAETPRSVAVLSR